MAPSSARTRTPSIAGWVDFVATARVTLLSASERSFRLQMIFMNEFLLSE